MLVATYKTLSASIQAVRSTGLPPIIDDMSHVIILGSMPSVLSLKLQQYYGNPKNQFWRIVYSLFGREPDPLYEDRVAFLREKRIALWDVIDSCERKGSLDSAIEHEKANDLNGLFRNYPAIGLVVFNGTKAERSFRTDISLDSSIENCLQFRTVPSSSPANAVKAEVKRSEWTIIRTYLDEQKANS